jgi:hypothetical protein
LVGAAVAFGLRSLGSKLALLDEGDVAYRAARANFGLIWVQGKGAGLPEYASWTQDSAGEWPRLASELLRESGVDVRACATRAAYTSASPQGSSSSASPCSTHCSRSRGSAGIRSKSSIATRSRRAYPGLGTAVAGGTYCPIDGHSNPLKLLRALHAATIRAGAAYRADHRVTRITPRGEGFVLDTGSRNALRRPKSSSRRGSAMPRSRRWSGSPRPCDPIRGRSSCSSAFHGFSRLPLQTIRQTDEGTVLIGDSQQDRGFDDSCGVDVLAAMARARGARVSGPRRRARRPGMGGTARDDA